MQVIPTLKEVHHDHIDPMIAPLVEYYCHESVSANKIIAQKDLNKNDYVGEFQKIDIALKRD